ncbi:MAG TPA: ankyrin repeat domain-containing protein [Gaiellaceae bacterium]|nr:ankyrin repeat domain-containing protein [Gaiellaceae bacterium]
MISELMQAQYRGDDATVARLLREGHELNVWEAAAVGDAGWLADLLDEDASLVNAWSVDGAQPLHFAAFFGRVEATKLLLERGADVNARAPGFNDVAPINSAAANDLKPNETCTELVHLLLAHGADPHAAQHGGATALDTARLTHNEPLIELLGG